MVRIYGEQIFGEYGPDVWGTDILRTWIGYMGRSIFCEHGPDIWETGILRT
jgi:hypothetical protein